MEQTQTTAQETINELLQGCNYAAKFKGFNEERQATWEVVINNKTFSYYEGIGHFINQQYTNKLICNEVMQVLVGEKKDFLASNYYKGVFKPERVNGNKLTAPKLADVMYCLIMDYQSATSADSFEDFCAEFGFDTDSRKALKVYEELQSNALKVVGLGLNLKKLQELYSDY